MKTRTILLASAAALLAAPSALAQAVDYGAMEELFGEPVTTSATGAPQRATDAPVNMTIISQEDIVRSGAIDIPGVLERLANVDVVRDLRGQADVSIRGYGQNFSPRLLVLVNGRQVYLDHYGMTNWAAIPVQMGEIRQIEVVSGPNTALFGFNAVSGVVNIITYDTLSDDVDEAGVKIGWPEYASGTGVWTQKINDRLGFRMSIGGSDAEPWNADEAIALSTFGRAGQDPQVRAGSFNLAYQLAEKVRTDFEATWSLDERLERFQGTLLESDYETNSFKLGVAADTDVGMVNGQVYSNYLDLTNFSTSGPSTIGNRITVGSVSLAAKPAPAHTIRVAGEYRLNEMEQSGGETAYDVYSVSGMWNWQTTDALAITSALRSDTLSLERTGGTTTPAFILANSAYDQEFTEISANVGALYKLTATDSIRLSAARGVGSPSLVDFGYQLTIFPYVGGTTLYYGGDPAIDPTIVYNTELGWDHDIASIGGRLRTAVFWQRNEDLKLFGATTSVPSMTQVSVSSDNIGESEAVGFEVGLEGVSGAVHWDAQYSWRDLEDELTVSPVAVQAAYDETTPEHVFTGGATWVGDKWEVGADARYTGDTSQYGMGAAPFALSPLDAYVQANARVAWLPSDDLRIEVTGRDVLEEDNQTVGFSPVQRSLYLSLTKGF